jgi:hypothetical protein
LVLLAGTTIATLSIASSCARARDGVTNASRIASGAPMRQSETVGKRRRRHALRDMS